MVLKDETRLFSKRWFPRFMDLNSKMNITVCPGCSFPNVVMYLYLSMSLITIDSDIAPTLCDF